MKKSTKSKSETLEILAAVAAISPIPIVGEIGATYTIYNALNHSTFSKPTRLVVSAGTTIFMRSLLYNTIYSSIWK